MATSVKPRFEFDVFLSFKGSDSLRSFCHWLRRCLEARNITCFKDAEELTLGANIQESLKEAIERSRILVPIFSADSTDSSSFLEEVGQIMSEMDMPGRLVIPIFYGVDPREVRRQQGQYKVALDRHKKLRGFSESKVKEWSFALSKAGSLKGLSGSQQEVLIEGIVEEISTELGKLDVFLNYKRGDSLDFVQRLYDALEGKGIKAFLDKKKIRTGHDFPSELMDAIDRSRIFVTVFSESYVKSKWCLDELVEILKRRNEEQRQMLPVFYKVKATKVSGQEESFVTALRGVEYGEGVELAKKYKEVISDAIEVQGELLNDGNEDDWIPRIVAKIEEMMRRSAV